MLSRLQDPLDRAERIARVRRYLTALGLKRCRAIIFGSVARDDFTADSDTDLLVISDELPPQLRQRLDVLFAVRDVAPEIEPFGWRESDWQRREADDDPFVGVLRREGLLVEWPGG